MTGTPSTEALVAAEDVVDMLRLFGLDDGQIEEAVIEAPESTEDLVEAVAIQGEQVNLLGTKSDVAAAKTGLLQDLLVESALGVATDHAYHLKSNLEYPLDSALAEYGYGFEFRPVGSDEWTEPDHEDHPRAFRLVVTDGTEPVSTTAFRYPPHDGYPSNLFRALGCGLNDTVLEEVGLKFLLLAEGSDSFDWMLLDAETVATLEDEYGHRLEVFGEPLVRRGPSYKYGWDGIDRSLAVDHKSEFGVPEPDDTYKIETIYDL